MLVFMLSIALTSIVDRRFSVHQCWYQIQPFAAVGDCGRTARS
jgi:hypothetical protein